MEKVEAKEEAWHETYDKKKAELYEAADTEGTPEAHLADTDEDWEDKLADQASAHATKVHGIDVPAEQDKEEKAGPARKEAFFADLKSYYESKGFVSNESSPEELTDKLQAIRNSFCPTGEGGGVDPSCSPGGSAPDKEAEVERVGQKMDKPGAGESVKQEILDRASKVEFSSEPHPYQEEIGPHDWKGIEGRMTDKEIGEMEEALEEAQDDYVKEHLDNYEPEVSLKEVSKDAGYGGESIETAIQELVDDHAGKMSEEQLEEVNKAIYDWTRKWGVDGIDSLIDDIGDDIPDDLKDDLKNYKEGAEDRISEAMDKATEEDLANEESAVREYYDNSADKREYLRDFYRENSDRYIERVGEAKEGVWAPDEEKGSESLKFQASNGHKYSVDVYKEEVGGIKTSEIQFSSDANDQFGVTGAGGAHEVFGKVVPGVVSYAQKNSPNVMTFTAAEPSRRKLYDRLAKTVSRVLPEYRALALDVGGKRQYAIVRRDSEEAGKVQTYLDSKAGQTKVDVLVNYGVQVANWWLDEGSW